MGTPREVTSEPVVTGCFAGVDFPRGRLFDTTDLDEAREICGRVFNPHRLAVIGRETTLHARMDHLALGPLSLNRLTWGAPVQVDPDRLADYYLISVPVRGTARFHLDRDTVDVSRRQACVVSAPQRFRFEADAQFDQIATGRAGHARRCSPRRGCGASHTASGLPLGVRDGPEAMAA